MLTLINSVSHGAGASTLTYFLAKTRGALLSKPALVISTSNDKPHRHMMQIAKDWESPSLKMVLAKLQTYTDIKTFCYKAESFLYYLNVEGSDIRSIDGKKGLNLLLQELRDNAVREGFESVWVDLDNYSGGFLDFVDYADLVLIPVKANILTAENTFEKIMDVRHQYVKNFGMQLKHPIYFCVQKYASEMSLSEIKKILKVPDKFIMPLGYDVELVRQFNKGTLSFYINEVLAEPKTTEQKTIHTHLKRMLKELKPQRR